MSRFGSIIRATIYGNDYFDGLQGVGNHTLEPLMAKFKADELGLFRHLSVNYPDFLLNCINRCRVSTNMHPYLS